jgi:transcription-repair coupling factor (superfamily II helicase)
MGARELERVMKSFIRGDVDVLIATTIIESGLDIPAAGTIVIDRADEFGLSELHQLRGRVGRGSHKARCLLLVDRWRPMRQVARERLKALEEMTQLGSGFAISMKDLEIRGAGNILGPQQSGHIAAIGYDMYCRLLKQVSDRIQQQGEGGAAGAGDELTLGAHGEERGVELELGLEAYLPADWIEAPQTRLEVLRELSGIASDADADDAERGLRDRFGRLPRPAADLVRTFRLRARLERLGITRLSLQQEAYLVEFDDRIAIERWLAEVERRLGRKRRPELRPLRTGVALVVIPERLRSAEPALAWIEELLGEGGSTVEGGRAASEDRSRAERTPR